MSILPQLKKYFDKLGGKKAKGKNCLSSMFTG